MSRVGETGVGEMGIGETGVGKMGVGETGPNRLKRSMLYLIFYASYFGVCFCNISTFCTIQFE